MLPNIFRIGAIISLVLLVVKCNDKETQRVYGVIMSEEVKHLGHSFYKRVYYYKYEFEEKEFEGRYVVGKRHTLNYSIGDTLILEIDNRNPEEAKVFGKKVQKKTEIQLGSWKGKSKE
jgi:hypothetical protein